MLFLMPQARSNPGSMFILRSFNLLMMLKVFLGIIMLLKKYYFSGELKE